jgi:sarcosine oxidase gamma subunit
MVEITERMPAGQWLVSGPDMPANTLEGTDPLAIWLAPGRRLVVAEAQAAAPEGDFVSDVSDGLVVIDLVGPQAWDILAMASSLDPVAVAPGRVAQVLFAGIKAIVYQRDTALRLHVERPLAPWLLDWLRQAATALG